MRPERLNALTDGVVAIVLTIMVLELKFPAEPRSRGHGGDAAARRLPARLHLRRPLLEQPSSHDAIGAAVTGAVLWTNHALLFCLTLFPLMIRWIDEAGPTPWPVASFGLVLVAASTCYVLLERALVRAEGESSGVKSAIGRGGKERAEFCRLYRRGAARLLYRPSSAIAIYVAVALMWLVPDRRFQRPRRAADEQCWLRSDWRLRVRRSPARRCLGRPLRY